MSDFQFNKIDSSVLGANVYSVTVDDLREDFASNFARITTQQNVYIVARVPVERIEHCHTLESMGFRFIELQLDTQIRLPTKQGVIPSAYEYVKIETPDKLAEARMIARDSIEHDRISRDPVLGRLMSGERYAAYLEDSYRRPSDEIWCVRNRRTGQFVTFRSHRQVSDEQVRLLIGGVRADLKASGLGLISSHFCFNNLAERGFRFALTSISASNLPILNMEVGQLGFRATKSWAVFRFVSERLGSKGH